MQRLNTKVSAVTIAVSIAIGTITVGCNDSTTTVAKDDAYYKTLAQSLAADMTLSEKLDIVSGPGMNATTFVNSTPINLGKDVSGVAGYINGVSSSKLNIPAIKLSDGPAGVRIDPTRDGVSGTFYATAWPVGTLLASTWNTDIVNQVGTAFGNEVKEYGIDFLLAPGMNIQRNPLNGRNFEYYSEDPLITGRIGAAMVNGIQSNGVGATIKHYFGNESETNRMGINDIAEPRTLREIYMRGFQIAIDEAKPWAIMSSYNKVNGTYVNQRTDAMSSILRSEWGFTGLSMTDWFAGISGFADWFSANDTSIAASANIMKAGNNLIEPGGAKTFLQAAISAGTLTEAEVTNNVVDILTQVQKTPTYNNYAYSNNPDLNSHATLARQAADEGMVLLKNSNTTLPIATSKKLAVFGVNQVNTFKGGTGSGDVHAAYTTDIVDGLASQYSVDTDLKSYYSTYFSANKVAATGMFAGSGHYSCAESTITGNSSLVSLLTAAATNDDVAVISIGREAGEGTDRTNTKGDYQLSDAELDMITQVTTAFHAQGKKVVAVLNVGGVMDTSWASLVDGILLAYQAGQDTGNSVADILSGTVNPSGKLAQTFPASYSDVPSSSSFPGVDTDGDGTADTIYYNEGIYVGYRYYNTFNKSVSYPFGYGLSYTSFSYGTPTISSNTLNSDGATGQITVTATVTNTGTVAGKEAAEVYVTAPEVKLKKPTIELKSFAKTNLLTAGTAQTLSFTIPAKILASYNPDGNDWIVEPGTYKLYVSPSSDVSSVTPITFTVNNEIVVSSTTSGALALPDGVTAQSFTTVTK